MSLFKTPLRSVNGSSPLVSSIPAPPKLSDIPIRPTTTTKTTTIVPSDAAVVTSRTVRSSTSVRALSSQAPQAPNPAILIPSASLTSLTARTAAASPFVQAGRIESSTTNLVSAQRSPTQTLQLSSPLVVPSQPSSTASSEFNEGSAASTSASSMTTFMKGFRTMKAQATIVAASAMSMLDSSDSFPDGASATIASTSMRPRPTRVPNPSSNNNNQPQVNPFTRTVFIVFGVLGGLAVVIAIGVIVMMQIRKKRFLTLSPTPRRYRYGRHRQNELNDLPKDPTADSMEVNPSLTAPERAIVNRALPQKNRLTLNLSSNSTSLSDAINSFVNKSRTVSYKISP